jgi:hypothetical protein
LCDSYTISNNTGGSCSITYVDCNTLAPVSFSLPDGQQTIVSSCGTPTSPCTGQGGFDITLDPTPTPTSAPTQTPTPTNTETPTNTPTPTNTDTPTQTPTPTITDTPTQTPTPTITDTPTQTPTPTITDTPTQTPTPTITDTPTNTPTPTVTPTEPYDVYLFEDCCDPTNQFRVQNVPGSLNVGQVWSINTVGFIGCATVISYSATAASISGSFLVALHFALLGYSAFLFGALGWIYVALKRLDNPLLILNATFLIANLIGVYNAY